MHSYACKFDDNIANYIFIPHNQTVQIKGVEAIHGYLQNIQAHILIHLTLIIMLFFSFRNIFLVDINNAILCQQTESVPVLKWGMRTCW